MPALKLDTGTAELEADVKETGYDSGSLEKLIRTGTGLPGGNMLAAYARGRPANTLIVAARRSGSF